jgi:ribosomal-protein-alanine N-acetyltransferase
MPSASVRIDPMTEADVVPISAMEGPTRIGEKELREELARPWTRTWVAREEGQAAIAFAIAWHVADELHLLNIATREDRRRRGIGRALLAGLLGYAREQRLRHVLLEVRRSNTPAIALYRDAGFFAMGVRPRYYPDDEDAIEMVLLLDPKTGAVVAHADEVRLER